MSFYYRSALSRPASFNNLDHVEELYEIYSYDAMMEISTEERPSKG